RNRAEPAGGRARGVQQPGTGVAGTGQGPVLGVDEMPVTGVRQRRRAQFAAFVAGWPGRGEPEQAPARRGPACAHGAVMAAERPAGPGEEEPGGPAPIWSSTGPDTASASQVTAVTSGA